MTSLTQLHTLLQSNPEQTFRLSEPTNLYSSPDCDSLVTQAIASHHLRISPDPSPVNAASPLENRVFPVRTLEDNYPGLLSLDDLHNLTPSEPPAPPEPLDHSQISPRIPAIIDFCQTALMVPNEYLWGGTIAPHYDCSGLMQAAFLSQGIQIPRDAYQQEAFATAIPCTLDNLHPLHLGDLIFFGTLEKATHVGIYLGLGRYLHSSGKSGRNGIAIDTLILDRNAPIVSHRYAEQFRGVGRIEANYRPQS